MTRKYFNEILDELEKAHNYEKPFIYILKQALFLYERDNKEKLNSVIDKKVSENILNYITFNKEVSKSQLLRKFGSIKPALMDFILNSLVKNKSIVLKKVKKDRGAPSKMYCIGSFRPIIVDDFSGKILARLPKCTITLDDNFTETDDFDVSDYYDLHTEPYDYVGKVIEKGDSYLVRLDNELQPIKEKL